MHLATYKNTADNSSDTCRLKPTPSFPFEQFTSKLKCTSVNDGQLKWKFSARMHAYDMHFVLILTCIYHYHISWQQTESDRNLFPRVKHDRYLTIPHGHKGKQSNVVTCFSWRSSITVLIQVQISQGSLKLVWFKVYIKVHTTTSFKY